MPFGQIEQSWFEDDLWSLHSIPPSPTRRDVIEPSMGDQRLVKSIATVATLDADSTTSPIPSTKHPMPVGSH